MAKKNIVQVLLIFVFLASAGSVAGYDCDSCSNCNEVLTEAGSATLTVDLSGSEGNCIIITERSDVVFDCGGHNITGIGYSKGVYVWGQGNITIKNCNISNFEYGIYFMNSGNNLVTNNVLRNNSEHGIAFYNVALSEVSYNNEAYSYEGIYMDECNDNQLSWNSACSNVEADIRVNGGGNLGQSNECELTAGSPEPFRDEGQEGCSFPCALCDDYDKDGVCDIDDNCHIVYNPDQNDSDNGCSIYFTKPYELDPVCGDACDKCPYNASTDPWADSDFDGLGNVCDPDADNDKCLNANDPWPTVYSHDNDFDNLGADCDNCPDIYNADQNNSDSDPLGDVCDDDDDNDGCWDWQDRHPRNVYGDSDQDGVPDDCDNCLYEDNPDQNNTDLDEYGDVCDNDDDNDKCFDEWDPKPLVYSHDNDGDLRGADCDNCPNKNNSNQSDINNNGIGDACDCYDVLQGPYETGVDCGGVCSNQCIQCTWCKPGVIIPIRLSGPTAGRIDVVFIPEWGYQNDMNTFKKNAVSYARDAFYKMHNYSVRPITSGYMDKFNFYYYQGGYGDKSDAEACCGSNMPGVSAHNDWAGWCGTICALTLFGCSCLQNEPTTFMDEAPYTDVPEIITPDKRCGCRSGGSLISDFTTGTVMHETGHLLFSLTDEYCGKTAYWQSDKVPNVWSSLQACQTDSAAAGWSLGLCRRIERINQSNGQILCQKDYYRYDNESPRADLMGGCSTTPVTNCEIHEADARRINWVLNNWPAGKTKGILTWVNINNGSMKEVYSEVVEDHPDVGLDGGAFTLEAYSPTNELLGSFGFADPRIGLGKGEDPVAVYFDNVTFPVILPFYDDVRNITIVNTSTDEVLASYNIDKTLWYYCNTTNYSSEECMSLDLDRDGVPDSDDKCLGTVLPEVFPEFLPNHYADVDGDKIFEVKLSTKNKPVVNSKYTLAMTYGCSCNQILARKPGYNLGENKYGCTNTTIEDFMKTSVA